MSDNESNIIPFPTGPKKVTVKVDSDETSIVADVMRAIDAAKVVYQQGGRIVEPRKIPLPDGAVEWLITPCSRPRIRGLAAEFCQFQKEDSTKKTNVPDWLPAALEAYPRLPFKPIVGIIESPTLRGDGTLITDIGFDEATGLFLTGKVKVTVPENPTKEDALASLALLLDVVCDFPFKSEADKSVWLSGILSALARPAIEGPVPLHIINATTRGSGKTKLVDVASIIATGRVAPRTAYIHNNEEMDKRISSFALAGQTFILLDNVVGPFGCPSLDMALTGDVYRARILGRSEVASTPMRAVWWATGNGMVLQADLARRSLLAQIDPRCAFPESRTGPTENKPWAHPDLLRFVMSHRENLLSAGLTFLRAYFVAGRPDTGLAAMDFPAWSRLIRNALVWAGFADPAKANLEARSRDIQQDVFESLLMNWPVSDDSPLYAGELLTIADIRSIDPTTPAVVTRLKITPEARSLWRTALLDWCPPEGSAPLPSLHKLGYALREARGRISQNRQLEGGPKTKYGIPWKRLNLSGSSDDNG
jgi:hypothetical protein